MKNTGFILGLLGIAVSSAISITFGVLELKKNRRMHEQDIELIVEGVRAKTKQPRNKNGQFKPLDLSKEEAK